MIQAFIFDLDGTLIDSEKDLMLSANVCMFQFGFPSHTEEKIKSFIGNGAMKLLERCLPEEVKNSLNSDEPLVDMKEVYDVFLRHYNANCYAHTFTHSGVLAFLEKNKNRPMAVLTNKPLAPTMTILRHLAMDHYFQLVVGGDSFATRKPDPEGLNHILRELGVSADEALMIGDGVPDIQAAQAAGVPVVAMLDGIGDTDTLKALKADYECLNFTEIEALNLVD